MIFLPIVERELRVAARRSGTYWMRCLFVAGVLGLWVLLLVMNQNRTPPAYLSQILFIALAIASFCFCLTAGMIFTSDCLSVEKRSDTLGLLFLTDLKCYDIVLGKLTAHSLHAFYGLLGVLPVLGLPLLLGGVSAGEFARLVLTLVAVMFQSLGLAMWVSAEKREARQSMLTAFVVILLVAGLLPALWWMGFKRFPFMDWLLLPSPGYTLRRSFDFCYQTRHGAGEYWLALFVVLLTGLVGFGLACFRLPRVWRNTTPAQEGRGHGKKKWFFLRDENKSRRQLRQKLEEANPYALVCIQDDECRKWVHAIRCWVLPFWCLLLTIAVLRPKSNQVPVCFIICLLSAFALHQLFKIMVAAEVSRQVSEDGQSGNLELVLTTSLPPDRIQDGVLRSMRLNLNPLRNTLQWMNAALIGAVLCFPENIAVQRGEAQEMFFCIIAGGWLVLPLDYWALAQVGLATAFKEKAHLRAVFWAIGKVLGASWLALFIWFFFLFGSGGVNGNTMKSLLFGWFGFGMILSIYWGIKAEMAIRHWKQLRE